MTATVVEPGTVRFERLLPAPAERVWAFITEADKRARWLAGGEFELRVGGRIALEFDHANLSCDKVPPEKYRDKSPGRHTGVVTRCEPIRVLAHTWNWGSDETEVTYELMPRGGKTLLVITHRRLPNRDGTLSVMSGWDVHTGILEDVLNGVEPRPFWTTHAKLEKMYEARV